MKKILSFVMVLIILFGAQSINIDQGFAAAVHLEEEPNEIFVELEFPIESLKLDEKVLEGQQFTQLSLDDTVNTDQPGLPALPVQVLFYAVPVGAEVGLEVVAGDHEIIHFNSPVIPGSTVTSSMPNLSSSSEGNGPSLKTVILQPEHAVYQDLAPYPPMLAKITNDGMFRNQRIIAISVYPIQYQPSTQDAFAYRSLSVKISLKGGVQAAELPQYDSPEVEEILRGILSNYEQGLFWRSNPAVETGGTDTGLVSC